jgi:ribonuclease D
LWHWRESEARAKNCPPRRVLRDDLVVELARRQSHEQHRIRAIRGMERRNYQRCLPAISDAIRQAIDLKDADWPHLARNSKSSSPPLTLLGQFLATALSSLCRSTNLAPSLVGTAQDIRDLVADRLQLNRSESTSPPALGQGWRAQVVGQVIDQLLAGELSVLVHDPLADNPLKFEFPEREMRLR